MSTHHNTIFISYRRSESQLHTLALYHRLQQEYRGQVFMDQQTMKVGENFRQRIEGQLQGCRVLLAVIGPGWASERLQNPRDWVRLEITTALKRGIAVIPVLIDGARMPGEAELPEDLHALLDVHALDLDHRRYFEQGVAMLVEALRELLDVPSISMALLLGAVLGDGVVGRLLPTGGQVEVVLNPVTVAELEPFISKRWISLKPTGAVCSMGANNRVGNHIEELKRPYGFGNGFVLTVMPQDVKV